MRRRGTTYPNPKLPEWAEGAVYLFGSDAGYHKVGYTALVGTRLMQFQGLPFAVWREHYIPTAYPDAEKWLHAGLAAFHVRHEWFRLPPDAVDLFRSITAVQGADDLPANWRPQGYYPRLTSRSRRAERTALRLL